MEMGMFVKHIKLDDEKRILIAVQDHMMEYLKDPETRKMIKQGAEKVLGDDFKQLEIGKNVCRITVTPETAEASMEKLETELIKGLEMAMAFMSQMGQQQES